MIQLLTLNLFAGLLDIIISPESVIDILGSICLDALKE